MICWSDRIRLDRWVSTLPRIAASRRKVSNLDSSAGVFSRRSSLSSLSSHARGISTPHPGVRKGSFQSIQDSVIDLVQPCLPCFSWKTLLCNSVRKDKGAEKWAKSLHAHSYFLFPRTQHPTHPMSGALNHLD